MATSNRADVVLLHGFSLTGASWQRVRTEAAARGLLRGRRVSAPDLSGHGLSAAASPIALERLIASIANIAAERFILAGYSMGGRIALHMALGVGTRVSRLVLIGATPGIADALEREQRRVSDERLADEMEKLTTKQFVELWDHRTRNLLAGQPADVRADAWAERARNQPANLARALRALGPGSLPPVWDRLPELTMPVVLLVGERDRKFRAIATAMAGQISDCRVEVIAGAGHAAHLEAPGEVAEAIFGHPCTES